jgi:hypothetical protein
MAARKVSRQGAKAQRNAKNAGRRLASPFFFFFLAILSVFAPWREKSRLASETWTDVHVSGWGGPFSTEKLADLLATKCGGFGAARPVFGECDGDLAGSVGAEFVHR